MDTPIIILFAVFVVCFVIRMSISFSMFATSITYYLLAAPDKVGQVFTVITGNMFSSYTMLAVLLLIFIVNMLNEGEVTDKLFSFCNGLLERPKGNMAQVNTFISFTFSGMIGSAIADVSGIGLMKIEQVKKEGYDPEFSCVITAASVTIGPVFPSSISTAIYAMLSGASVGKFFMGGMVSRVLLAALLMVRVTYISHRRNCSADAVVTLYQFGRAAIIALLALLTVILLLGGVCTGVYTPMKADVIASACALLISLLTYRILGPRKLISIIRKSTANTAVLALLRETSMLFSYIISLEQIPAVVTTVVTGIMDNKYTFLFMVNIMFLLPGCMLDVSTVQLVFVPMVFPLVRASRIGLVHFGVVICLNMMIRLSTPPFGMLLFTVAGLGKTRVASAIREILPMMLIMIGLLSLVTYVPDIVLFIPNTFM